MDIIVKLCNFFVNWFLEIRLCNYIICKMYYIDYGKVYFFINCYINLLWLELFWVKLLIKYILIMF